METRQQHTLMKFDPVDGSERPYPSSANQYRAYHGDVAWLYCPWTGKHRDPRDIGSDVLGHLILPPGERVYAAPLESVEARYKDLLERLGAQGHDGAVSEITKLREARGLN